MATKQANPDQADAPKKKGKLILIIVSAVLVISGGGGAAWFFLRPSDTHTASAPPKPAVFLPLENFIVNLLPQDGQPQYLQAGLTLKLGEQVKADVLKDRMPEIRDKILMVLSGKRAGDVLPNAGKQKLAVEIAQAVVAVLRPAGGLKPVAPVMMVPVAPAEVVPEAGEAAAAPAPAPKAPVAATQAPIEVLFTSFIVQ